MRLEASENLFWVIFASKLTDDEAILFILAKLFRIVDRTKQPAGYMRISKKFVFTSTSLPSRYRQQVKMALLEQL